LGFALLEAPADRISAECTFHMAIAAPHAAQKAEPLGMDLPQRGQGISLTAVVVDAPACPAAGFWPAVNFFK